MGSFLGVLVDAKEIRKKCLGQHNIFSKDPVEKKNHIPTKLIDSCPSKRNSKNHYENWHHGNLPKVPIVPCKDFGPLGVNNNQVLYI